MQIRPERYEPESGMTVTLYELCGSDPARPFSPHCWKTVMSLAHKGIDFRREQVPFTAIPEVEDGVGKTVPIIRDGDTVVVDSFEIALYLDRTYPDRPSLFKGEGGQAMARFVESWAATQIHTVLIGRILLDIYAMLGEPDQGYFRESREARFGMPLEQAAEVGARRFDLLRDRLDPMRMMLKRQPFIGGGSPLFCDYILFGALQWARVTSPAQLLEADDPVAQWFETCLDLYDGIGRSVPAAA
jgi:glutathione S-transferase